MSQQTPDSPTTADAARERHVDAALAKLDLEGKVRLLSGASTWAIAPNPDIGLGSIVMSDGPVGVRGVEASLDSPSIQLPSPTAIAATWDVDLVRAAGRLLAQEARRKNVHVLLAPTINMHRTPLGGRHFECYSEDPHLTGEIGGAYVTGVQEGGVATTPKHFVANDSETDRFVIDVRVDERALREIYLAPFEAIVRRVRPWGVMAAYNKVNGTTMTEHAELNAVLREEWGFDGFIVSDWTAARDTVRDALAGMDIAMPGPRTVYGEHLVAAVREGRVPEEAVDAMARRVLRLAARVGLLEGAEPVVPATRLPPAIDGRALAREVARRSFTLLRNEEAALPIDVSAVRRVALIGLAAKEARTNGGGSATVFAERTVSPLEGLRAALGDGTELTYAVGADPRTRVPAIAGPVTVTFHGAAGEVLAVETLDSGGARWMGELPEGVTLDRLGWIDAVTDLTPLASGTHTFGLSGVGHFTLTVGDEVLFEGAHELTGTDPGEALLNPPQSRHQADLTEGEQVRVGMRLTSPGTGFGDFTHISFALGHLEPLPPDDQLIEEAERVAASADVAVVVAATTAEVESEGFDRSSLRLPGRQDELVARVAAANPRTVVVVNAGSPVVMPWRDDVAAILLTWFGGQELGAALADVLLGAEEPGGRLPTTWPAREEDAPVLNVRPTEGRLDYEEGVFIGYRAWERAGTAPAFWFGHGLSYTRWRYDGIEVERGGGDALATVRVRATNTGERAGREVVQVYLAPRETDPERPARWLVGFAMVRAEPGESVTASVMVARRAAEVWDSDAHAWRLVAGEYEILAGRSYADTALSAVIRV